jgi:two-component system, response regulator YesN
MSFVLIVDDDLGVREAFTQVLSRAGIEAASAETGREGLRLARAHAPRLMLSDLRLPDMTGLELLRALRADGHTMPVVIMTACGSTAAAVEAMKLGAADYLEKPIDGEHLLTVITSIGGSRSAPNESWSTREASAPTRALDPSPSTNPRVHRTLETLSRRFHEPGLTLDSLARGVGVTPEHLCRLLRRHVGSGFTAQLRRARVAAAQQLLRDTMLSAKEVAFRVGFRSVNRFNRDFKRLCGVPPTVYRRAAAAGAERRGGSLEPEAPISPEHRLLQAAREAPRN